jgi:dephospho-CoA kinase
MLLRHGAAIVDADAIAHESTQPGGAAIDAIRAAFGAQSIDADGALDRAWMRARAFGDAEARRTLERLLHPLIRVACEQRAEQHVSAGSPYVVFVIPLLVESRGGRDRFDRVLLVDCSEAIQLARIRARPGIDEPIARSILAVQATRAERLKVADDVVFNEAPLALIDQRVERLHEGYLALATDGATRVL